MDNLCDFVLNTGSTILFDLNIEMLFKNLLCFSYNSLNVKRMCAYVCVRERMRELEKKSNNLFWYLMLLVS